MGVCASCLGLNRHPSHKQDETDGLLSSQPPSRYGTLNDRQAGEGEERDEDAFVERQALEAISARATDDMIDVLHAGPSGSHRGHSALLQEQGDDDDGEDAEQAWLNDLPVSDLDQDVGVKGSYKGDLVIDIGHLRDDSHIVARREL